MDAKLILGDMNNVITKSWLASMQDLRTISEMTSLESLFVKLSSYLTND